MLTLAVLAAGRLAAVDVTIGTQVWFAWWRPAWDSQEYTSDPGNTEYSSDLRVPDPQVLAGPVLSVSLGERLTLSSALAFGGYWTWGPRIHQNPNNMSFEELDIRKYDLDTTLSYAATEWLRLFAGIKIQGYDYFKERTKYDRTAGLTDWKTLKDTRYFSIGPGVGAGVSLPLIAGLYATVNAGVLALWARETTEMEKYWLQDPTLRVDKIDYVGTAFIAGGNTSASLVYFVPESRLALSLGFRYQGLRYFQDRNDVGEYYFDGKIDHFYGATASLLYTFQSR
jgi:hypothetical protein